MIINSSQYDRDLDEQEATLRALTIRLVRLADSAGKHGSLQKYPISRPGHEDDGSKLLELAKAEYHGRRRRAQYVSGDLLGEPAWDILLDLFIQEGRDRRVSVNSVCKATGSPNSTALRWLAALGTKGLVERQPSGRDMQVQYVRLSEAGVLAVSGWLRYRSALQA